MNRAFFDNRTLNILAMSWLSSMEALQVLIAAALAFSFIPISVPPLVPKFFPLTQSVVHLERTTLLYHVWIAVALGVQAIGLWVMRRRLAYGSLWRRWGFYMLTTGSIVFVQVFAVFKIFLWGNPWWARDLLYVSLAIAVAVRIFWPEFRKLSVWLWEKTTAGHQPWAAIQVLGMDAVAVLILAVLVFTPNLGEVLARMFSYDKFYHLDGFVLSPAWAHHTGLILNKDVTSEYSLIMPIVFDKLMQLAGGFSYSHAVGLMIALSAVYYFCLYALWRYWIGSIGLCFFAVVLCLKLQFFHWGVTPLIWIYINATPVRDFTDVFFLFFILRFAQTSRWRWLAAAAVTNGLALVWTMDVGVYMYVAFAAAMAAAVYQQGLKALPKTIGLLFVPAALALAILSVFYGPLVGQSYFWHNTFEFASLFMQGWGALPITNGLNDKQFFAFWMGLAIPAAYMAAFLYSAGVFLFQRSRPHLFLAIVCIYGLGVYHYFIHRSGVTSYYAVIVPFMFVVLFWAKAAVGLLKPHWQKAVKIILCAGALGALVTSYWYTYYPNWLNLSGWNWAPEKEFYIQQFDFSRDASLIDALTKPHEPVALVSSFETRILMQADRRPYFYYFPMVESEHMQGKKLRGIYIHTYARLTRTLHQLEDDPPAHIFIQTRLWTGPEAQKYEEDNLGFRQLMAHVRLHYEYQDSGQYLTALKLK